MLHAIRAILGVRGWSFDSLRRGFRVMPTSAVGSSDQEGMQVKGSQKPKKLGKKPAQKTLKERRTEKRAAAKHASRGLDV